MKYHTIQYKDQYQEDKNNIISFQLIKYMDVLPLDLKI